MKKNYYLLLVLSLLSFSGYSQRIYDLTKVGDTVKVKSLTLNGINLQQALDSKISTIKTLNGNSLLGTGNVVISGGAVQNNLNASTTIPPSASAVNTGLASTIAKAQIYDYIITKVGATVYANSPSGLTTYSGTFNSVINAAISASNSIYIRRGLYDALDRFVISKSGVSITGEQGTILKAKNGLDIGTFPNGTELIYISANNTIIRGIELDGNFANQTIKDNNITQNAKLNGITIGVNASYNLIEGCTINSFPQFGVNVSDNAHHNTISNSSLSNNAWNNITLQSSTSYNVVEGCTTFGSADVSITAYGKYQTIRNNTIGDVNGVNGSTGSRWGIGLEFDPDGTRNPSGSLVEGNTISGATILVGVRLAIANNSRVSNNTIHDLSQTEQSVGIDLENGFGNLISNNRIYNVLKYGVSLGGTSNKNTITGNKIDAVGDGSTNDGNGQAIILEAYGVNSVDNNFITNNDISGYYRGLFIIKGTKNVVMNNKLHGNQYSDIFDNGTGNIKVNNYGVKTNGMLP